MATAERDGFGTGRRAIPPIDRRRIVTDDRPGFAIREGCHSHAGKRFAFMDILCNANCRDVLVE